MAYITNMQLELTFGKVVTGFTKLRVQDRSSYCESAVNEKSVTVTFNCDLKTL